MQRVTLRIPKKQVEEVEAMVENRKFPNRSEAIRAAVRDLVDEERKTNGKPPWKRASAGSRR